MKELLSKFISRKFLVTLVSLVLMAFGVTGASDTIGVDQEVAVGIAGLVSTVYIVAQGLIDHARAKAGTPEALALLARFEAQLQRATATPQRE